MNDNLVLDFTYNKFVQFFIDLGMKSIYLSVSHRIDFSYNDVINET